MNLKRAFIYDFVLLLEGEKNFIKLYLGRSESVFSQPLVIHFGCRINYLEPSLTPEPVLCSVQVELL